MLDSAGLRPTPDRIRETVFNWLARDIQGAQVLDCFAGAGSLGFEAASREAAQVWMVDMDFKVTANLQQQKTQLDATNIHIVTADISAWIKTCDRTFDIVFIDPPYAQGYLRQQMLDLLSEHSLLNPGCKIYLEWPHKESSSVSLQNLHWIKQKKAGQVAYALAQWQGSR